jgi:hypothetical protein
MEACLELIRARLSLRERALGEIRAQWGAKDTSAVEVSEGQLHKASSIAQAVQSMASHMPGDFSCLVQSTSLLAMLYRRGIPAVLRFGAAKGSSGIKTHAWVESGGHVVLDTAHNEAYIPFDRG